METLQPILKRGRDVWDPINMPKGEFLQRVEKIREKMAGAGIGVLLLYGDLADSGYPCYISNYVVKLPAGALVIVPLKGDVTLFFVGASRELKIGQKITWVDDTRSSLSGAFSATGGSLAGDCVKYLQEKKLIPSKIGLAGVREFMSYLEFQRLLEGAAGSEFVDAVPLVNDMRMIKSVRESDQIRRASRIVSNTLGGMPGMTTVGRNERQIEAKLDWAARVQGAEDVRILLAKPLKPNWALRPAEAAAVSPGDSLIVYLAASFERYWAEGIRTYRAEESSFVLANDDKTHELFQQLVAALKPGKPVSQFYRETMEELRRRNVRSIPGYGLGHGIGLSMEEAPVIDEKDANRFAEGMCLVLRMAAADQERGAVMTGNTIHLSQAGAEVLTI
jgi:Xaa-Pro aminopeptidase